MKLSKTVLNALNKQINKELYSWYTYLSIAAYFREQSLNGFASWFSKQAEEERGHAMKIHDYVLDRNESVSLDSIAKPTASWKGPLQVAQSVLKHEQGVSKSILDLKSLAQKEKDLATDEFLNWFVSEQVEEEASASELLDRVSLAGEKGHGLLILDQDLAKRE